MLFSGYTASSHHKRVGGGSNHLCLPEEPQLQARTGGSVHAGWLYGITYRTSGGTTAYHAKPAPCAVCYVPQRSAQLMIPASNSCSVGWTREYNGYLMSQYSWGVGTHSDYYHATTYICVDASPEIAVGPSDQNQGNIYFVRVGCGNLPCSKFTHGMNVPCVICTK